ncbi:tryptophan 2,3-dioxygenase [Chitinophaga alhagiae]|uniref:Tryptophan 2,3-dioxygenase n=1 Tax=Chitinophaga alhagiae TaxID=2203219 RepID=A0ABM6WB70_9BACT|nr:tryptophan 2,3-dioxygenase family protein [Chitinophaga alhagiae]AWO01250.1 tryptophan 2,3-dioxygenase [Chitinophaga alhagiae]
MNTNVQYGDYLQLDKILNAQFPESDKYRQPAHDEMLFIVIHQAYELWFKQLLYETESVADILKKPVNDNSPELQTIVHRLSRMVTILKLLVQQIDVMETMTPMDFLDFRDMLRPASGFQSWQFKVLEARLGLQYEQRFGQEYYISQLQQDKVDMIRRAESEKSILTLVNEWLERMPFFNEPANWAHYNAELEEGAPSESNSTHIFWRHYRQVYQNSLAEAEQGNLAHFDAVFGNGNVAAGTPPEDGAALTAAAGGSDTAPGATTGTAPAAASEKSDMAVPRRLSPKACRAALFIMLYRGYPLLQLPFQLLNSLLETDEQLSTWRYRHMSMVHRMIGSRIGTGGSTGRNYLKGALDKHYIFADVAKLTSFLIERRKLPVLSPEMGRRLGFT